MNKDNKILEIECRENSFRLGKVLGQTPFFITNFGEWVDSRTSPMGSSNINKLMKAAGINNRESFLKIGKAISLNDTIWVNSVDKPLTWSQVSPYSNRLSRIISEIALNNNIINLESKELKSPSPEYCTGGSFPKCWRRINGKLYLMKAGTPKVTDITGNEPYSEYYSYQVAKQLGIINITNYFLGNIKGEIYSYCECFTTEEKGYLPIAYTNANKLQPYDLLDYMESIDSGELFREMLLLDSIILNIDRHSGNFGFIMNNNTYKIDKMAPIFDNNMALVPRLSLQRPKDEIIDYVKHSYPKTIQCSFIDQAKFAMNDRLKSNLKNMYPFHFDRSGKYNLREQRLRFIESLVNFQIRLILKNT